MNAIKSLHKNPFEKGADAAALYRARSLWHGAVGAGREGDLATAFASPWAEGALVTAPAKRWGRGGRKGAAA